LNINITLPEFERHASLKFISEVSGKISQFSTTNEQTFVFSKEDYLDKKDANCSREVVVYLLRLP